VSRYRTSAGSIFWGLTLVAIGGLLLARNMGYAIPIWSALVTYWPVLIIVWGLFKLVDYARLKNDPDKRPLFSGGEVFLLILLIFAGSAITAGANMSPQIGELFNLSSNFDFWDLTGNNYQYSEHQEMDAASGSAIEIYNLYGEVDVKPGDGDRIILDVTKTVRAANKEEADRLAQDFTFSIKNQGDRYRIASNRDADLAEVQIRIGNERQRYKSSMVLRVPRKARLDLNNKYGTIDVEGLEGLQSLTNKYGSSTVKGITGNVKLDTGYGSVLVDNITGDLDITNGYASTTARHIGGHVIVGNKNGAVDVQDVKGGVTIDNRYSIVNAQRISGDLTITGRNNSVDVDDIGGTVSIDTEYKNVNVRNARGSMKLTNRHGNVDIELEQAPQNSITVSGEYSDVSLYLPASAAFSIEGKTHYGEIDSEFDGVPVNSSGRDRSVLGHLGNGGPHISVETQHGNIRLEKRG
jgi:Putative adhesin/Domain of unknown function (DUF5668)